MAAFNKIDWRTSISREKQQAFGNCNFESTRDSTFLPQAEKGVDFCAANFALEEAEAPKLMKLAATREGIPKEKDLGGFKVTYEESN